MKRYDLIYHHLKEVPSTNTHLLNSDYPPGVVLTTDHQTAGRGRSGRTWNSQKGTVLAISILLPHIAVERLFGLQVALGYAVVDVLNSLHKDKPFKLKWPNDIVIEIGGKIKKVGGMLIDTRLNGDKVQKIVFGTGINLADFEGMPDTGVSLASLHCTTPPIKGLTKDIAEALMNNFYDYFEEKMDIRQKWSDYSAFLNREIRFHKMTTNSSDFFFIAVEKGIDLNGEIVVQSEFGEFTKINSLEIGYDFGF